MHSRTQLVTAWLGLAILVSQPSLATAADPFAEIETVVNAAIARNEIPGAVVAVVHRGEVVFRKALGQRAKEPAGEPMTLDTIFDLASLTKPIATATSVMILVQDGKLKLDEKVMTYWPEFGRDGKETLTLEHLLTHTSGLIADNPLKDYADGPMMAMDRICHLKPLAKPNEKFIYSDVNFIVLGEVVRRVSGRPLDEFARDRIYKPLGMKDTRFRPPEGDRARCAPTEQREGRWMRGEVHDPRAYALGGVAGHAGLFATVDDLVLFANMMLNKGDGILKPQTVARMTEPHTVPGGKRGLGWDVRSSFSSNRGEHFGGYGHTGFTGTSIWIDPECQAAVIFLSNRVHPKAAGGVNALRNRVATIAARVVKVPAATAGGAEETLTGIDVLVRDQFAPLRGRRVGLVTNHTGRDRFGNATIDLLHKADGVKLVALFGPEHGIRGALDENVRDTKDEKTGLPVYSLYGPRRKPTPELLKGIDTVVFDIQDVGCRFYTFSSTLGLVMEACADNKLKLVVLDRPNPIGGLVIEGPLPDPGRSSFVAYHSVPLRHGMTFGELAQMYRAERKHEVDLQVIKCEGWKRADFYDRTRLPWVNPSPNMRSLTQALLYPGIGLLEFTNVSVGRGTETPFEWIGAPWLDGRKLAGALAVHRLPGVRFVPCARTPKSSVHASKLCGGIQIFVDDWKTFQPVRTGMTIAEVLRATYPTEWDPKRFDTLMMNKSTTDALLAGQPVGQWADTWSVQAAAFHERRRPYLLYD